MPLLKSTIPSCILVLLFSMGSLMAQNKVYAPFYDAFNGLNEDYWSLEVKEANRWDVVSNYSRDTLGNSLKIRVEAEDSIYVEAPINMRSRAEVKIFPDKAAGEHFFYAWSILIPDDGSFNDEDLEDEGYHIISQWHKPPGVQFPCGNSEPTIKLVYKHDSEATDDKRTIRLNYGTKSECDEERLTLDLATIEKGEWLDIISEINWSADEEIGFIRFWINGQLFEPEGYTDGYIKGANMYEDANGRSQPNYFKLGHYRGGTVESHTLYIDEFSMGSSLSMLTLPYKLSQVDYEREEALSILGNKLNVYPTPATDKLYFKNTEFPGNFDEQVLISVYNMYGQEILQRGLPQGTILSVDVSDIERGAYYYRVHTSADEVIKEGKLLLQ